jgi:hypothetical protein
MPKGMKKIRLNASFSADNYYGNIQPVCAKYL